jgi:ApaG protein
MTAMSFAYAITIENVGTVPAQLIARHWIITDAVGEVQEVRGLGVVGRQPLLQPGENSNIPAAASSTPRWVRCVAVTR